MFWTLTSINLRQGNMHYVPIAAKRQGEDASVTCLDRAYPIVPLKIHSTITGWKNWIFVFSYSLICQKHVPKGIEYDKNLLYTPKQYLKL